MPKIFAASLLMMIFTLTMCKKESAATYDCAGVAPTYSADIKAIIDTNCAISGCHNASTSEAGVNLSTYTSVKAESGNDRFLGVIQHLSGYPAMPKGSAKLPEASIQKIYCWIENGQPE